MESNQNNQSSIVPKVVGGIVAVLVCCACVAILAAGLFIYRAYQNSPVEIPTEIFPPVGETSTPQPTPTVDRPPADSVTSETMDILNQTLIPENDPYELACRLEKICDVSKEVPGKTYKVGDKETFWILNGGTVEHNQITATLLYITPHTYFWAQEGVEVNQDDMKRLMDTIEEKIYPTDREFFGSEWIQKASDYFQKTVDDKVKNLHQMFNSVGEKTNLLYKEREALIEKVQTHVKPLTASLEDLKSQFNKLQESMKKVFGQNDEKWTELANHLDYFSDEIQKMKDHIRERNIDCEL